MKFSGLRPNWLAKSLLAVVPLAIFLILWQIAAWRSNDISFFFGSPIRAFEALQANIMNGILLLDLYYTAFETIIGFLAGVILGSSIGFTLLYFPRISEVSRMYVIALGAIPIFALAPMMIVWFGVGIEMKIAMAFFSTVFISLTQAYNGGSNVDKALLELFKLNNASRRMTFQKLVLPSSMDWVFASLRLNIGLAMLGAFIGEFMSSEVGLGYRMLRAGGLYDVPLVLAAVVMMIIMAITLNYCVRYIEKRRIKVIQILTVQSLLRKM
jgi:NitT/TauT family transport system permease protein